MADTTQFGHDQLAHLLADYLLEVPRFQRAFSWDESNVEEFLADLAQAQRKNVDYFMGTVVFARPSKDGERRQIVDGQQRLATTAILLIAVRDLLREYGKEKQANEIEKRFLRGYVLSADDDVERLILSANDVSSYVSLLDGDVESLPIDDKLKVCYDTIYRFLRKLSPSEKSHRNLIDLSIQLENRVQLLVAEANDLPEAYVIFETLNDRGADLTTADLLKNYLFSASGQYFSYVERCWTALEGNLDRSGDLVKFIRYEFASRRGQISGRKLYRSIQGDVGTTARAVKRYVDGLFSAQRVYLALRDPESSDWADVNIEVQDALFAYRRFGFEASIPVLLAAFTKWDRIDACKLLVKLAKWSIRAQFGGRLGGGVADETFGETALKISSGAAKNQTQVRALLSRLIPTDEEFGAAFVSYGDVTVSRAKYLLAMLEKADESRHQRPHKPLEWHTRSVTIEHISPLSSASQKLDGRINELGNLALLEKRLNTQAGGKPFADKRTIYRESAFELTQRVAIKRTWKVESIRNRTRELADLACLAWPSN